MNYSEQVVFHPWIGENYGEKSRWGIPLLIVGESHYSEEAEAIAHFTQQCVATHIRSDWQETYWTNMMNTVLGRSESPTVAEKKAFWDSVAFYTYVQEVVGVGPEDHVTKTMWREAEEPFLEVVRELEPWCILVFGRKLWSELPEPDRRGPVVQTDNLKTETKHYQEGLTGRLDHPLWPGYSPRKWGALAQDIIEAARRDARGRET